MNNENNDCVICYDMDNERIETNPRRMQYITHPYNLWFPIKTDYLTIEKINRSGFYVEVIDGLSDRLFINFKRVRTPHDGSSKPCVNCGHYIDNNWNIYCNNGRCKRNRRGRRLCEKEYHSNYTWLHGFDYKSTITRRGVNYHVAVCKNCDSDLRWLGDYEQASHVIQYNNALPKKTKTHDLTDIIFKNSRVVIGGSLRHGILKKFNYKCADCGATREETTLHIDHIKPISRGGDNHPDNLQVLCKKCNLSKHTDEWVGGI